jgi:hypothetical protein
MADRAIESEAPRAGRLLLTGLCLLAAGVTIARYVDDSRTRRAALRFARAAAVEKVSPDEESALASEPAGDLAVAAAVSAVLASGRSVPSEVLSSGTALVAQAAAERPGWAYHRYLLARTDAAAPGERSRRTLRLAATGAPGMDTIWSALARADLASWSSLTPAERAEAPEIFRLAFRDETLVEAELPSVAVLLGQSRALSLLPDETGSLNAAAGVLAERGDAPGAARLLSRAEAAERREREQGLVELERRALLGDLKGLYEGCGVWFEKHPFEDLDDVDGRQQIARLLALWPDIRFGSWSKDRRARLIRFFLEGRTSSVSAEALLRSIESLSGVPEAVRARVYVLAGNIAGAQALAQGAGPPATFEWDPYTLELGRRSLAAGKPAEARAALAGLSLSARDGCEATLLRRDLARAMQDAVELAAAEARLAELEQRVSEKQNSGGAIEVCVDPARASTGALEVAVGPGSPALIAFGFDGGRAGAASFPADGGSFRLALSGLAGRHRLWTSFLLGDRDRSLHACLKGSS